jgi:AraC-like DNA-binding protein
MRFSIESDDPAGFRGSMRIRHVAGIEFIAMTTGRHVAYRDAENIAGDERPDYLLCLQLEGEGEFSQDGRTAVLRPGDITLFDTTRPTVVASGDDYRSVCMRFPQHLLDVPHRQMNEMTAVRFAARDGLTPAAGAVISNLDRVIDDIPLRSRSQFAHNALDLVGTLMTSRLGIADAPMRRPGDAVFEQMDDFIKQHLSDSDLAPGTIAAAHFTSLRRVHGIFNAAGFTVAGRIHQLRLERCRRDLTDPTMADLSVSSIGLRWGFKTASHFGRAFKIAFGQTPADYREQSRGF